MPIQPPARVVVRYYNDRGDPIPPNNYRVEIEAGGHTFLPDWRATGLANSSCVPIEEAYRVAGEVARALGLEEPKP